MLEKSMYMEEAQPSTVQSTPVPAKSESQIIRNNTAQVISSSNDKWGKNKTGTILCNYVHMDTTPAPLILH